MMIKSLDKSFKWVWIMVLQETLRFNQVMALNEYVTKQHREKDTYIEDWLADKIKIFTTQEEADEYLKKQTKEEIRYVI